MASEQHRPAGAAGAEWRAHWPLVLASMLGFSLVGLATLSLGAFIAPLEKAFGWTRAEVTSGLTVYAVTCVICQPIVGRMIDRWGPRRIGLVGLPLSGAAFALFATAGGSLTGWLLLWLAYSLAIQLVLTPVWSVAVASEFEAGRGLALAVTLSGSGFAGIVAPILATLLIGAYGWRAAYAILGGGGGLLIFAVAYFLFYSRRDRLERSGAPRDEVLPPGSSAREGLRSPTFFKLGFATLVSYSLVMALVIHMLPILSDGGLSREQAAVVAGCFGIFAIIGKLVCGVLVSHVRGNVIAAVLLAIPISTCVMLMTPSSSVLARIVALGLLGASAGAQLKMLVYLTTRHFGLRAFGTIFGFLSAALTLATGIGPFAAGFLFDLTHSYQLLLMAGIPLSVVASLLMLWVGDYPDVPQQQATAGDPAPAH